MKCTPLKVKNNLSLKKTPLKSNKGLKGFSVLKKSGNLKITLLANKGTSLKKTKSLKNNGTELKKETELKKQNEKSKEKWEQVRNQVLERDNHKCVVCGKPATQVHHIHLRSKRKDLVYEINNLVSLCNHCHNHQSDEGLEKVNRRIARALHMTLEQLLRFAEITEELKNSISNAREYIQNLNCLKKEETIETKEQEE